VLAISLVHSED
jgi:hypothetical protein